MTDLDNRNWYRVNINIDNAVRPDWSLDKLLSTSPPCDYNDTMKIWRFDRPNIDCFFTTEWIEYMDSIGLAPRGVLLFYRGHPHTQHPDAHIDQTILPAINWVHTPNDDGEMVWYKTPDEPPTRRDRQNLDPALLELPSDQKIARRILQYWEWPSTELVEIERCIIGHKPTLVRTDVPHNIVVNQQPRLAVSVRVGDPVPDLTWQQAVDALKHVIQD